MLRLYNNQVKDILGSVKQRAADNFPGASLVSVYSHTQKQMITVPIGEAVAAQFGHAIDYGTGCFEGSSALVHERTGVPHVVLLEARSNRLYQRSLPARLYEAPVSQADFNTAMLDLIVQQGLDLFRHPDGKTSGYVRAYIRPTVQPASYGGFGISMKPGYPIDAGIIAWAWPDYLDPTLSSRGGVAAITGQQRLFPITGKHASNYGAAAADGNLVRSMGADELIYLAPYMLDKSGNEYWADPTDVDTNLRDGAICDGPGEECVALTADQKTLVYVPMRANRLGGTVLQYIIDYMAPTLGLQTLQADISLHDLRNGNYAGMAMVGNAVKVTPVRKLDLYKGEELVESIELFEESNIPERLLTLQERWDQETRGIIDPSHPSLITPVE
jgi:branched-subunit amino acid aminotransferase/4-amino-4-deoxychorismate lyase